MSGFVDNLLFLFEINDVLPLLAQLITSKFEQKAEKQQQQQQQQQQHENFTI